ncbi:MAG: PTS sugar transporter subunit IIA [Streptococcaceae bacterium]|jgi:PTS system ascorbate-specific IIA component|nr:PTS sugar transporter subunit IIA [Streptococcaceae bacterium]
MGNLLNDFYEKRLVEIYDESPESWEEAINLAGQGLMREGYITGQYIEEIIQNVKENGPYIVIVPGVVIPHAMARSEAVLGTAIGFSKFREDVVFDEEKRGKLFFTLAARDEKEHLENIGKLMDLLMTDGMIERLGKVENLKEYENLLKRI